MSLVIKKFGGTSLANISLIKNAASRIIKEIDKGNKVIVIVSAMAGVTSDLLELSKRIATNSNTAGVKAEIDSVISTGEQISAGLMALALQKKEIKARSFSGWQIGLVTDGNYGAASVKSLDTKIINAALEKGQVPVITGFQGVNSNNRITTLGRGTSDLTAVLIASMMKADRCDLFTDVDGVFTADPKIVNKAKKINKISYEEMYEMSRHGSKVIQSEAVRVAAKYKVPIRVLSSFSPNQQPTIMNIEKSDDESNRIRGIASIKNNCGNSTLSIIGMNLNKDNRLIDSLKTLLSTKKILVNDVNISKYKISINVPDLEIQSIIRELHDLYGLDKICV